ncbi:MAG TPA: FlgD immunoglobulin-like domain containing protein [Candidatus Krumholzibacteria bacterium]|nr:FlgD immunoglobulin-like domain containing protein [Candidatus Krumholzibacteria bacterium]
MPRSLGQALRRPPATAGVFAGIVAVFLLVFSQPASAQTETSIGIYNDPGGVGCTLSDISPGLINAYVVVRPGTNASTGVQFAAPKPACFDATYVADIAPAGVLTIGNSQTGISIALLGCRTAPVHALTIQYSGTGTTGLCCEYPVVADPSLPGIISADCYYNEEPAVGIVANVNADATCPCAGNSPPDAPFAPAPPSGAAGISVFTSLAWTATDVDNNLAEYDVYLGTSPGPPLVATVTEPTYTPGQLDELQLHYWRVVARDTGGLEHSGPEWTFTTRPTNSPPGVPAAQYPLNGAVNIPVNLSASWVCGDIDGDTLVYDVYFGTETTPPLVVSDSPSALYAPPTLAYGQDYHWRVVARDPDGLETSGATWTFQTHFDNYPPNAPVLAYPGDGAVGIPVSIVAAWSGSDIDGDTLVYDVYFGTSAPPPLVVADSPATTYTPAPLDYGQQYYWRVVARDPDGLETSGAEWTFRTRPENYPPYPPVYPSPANFATNISTDLTVTWQAIDPDVDPLNFDVYLGTNADSLLLIVSGLTINSYHLPPLLPAVVYYWRVVVRDSHGAETPGPLWMFSTSPGVNQPPVTPYSPAPGNNATDVPAVSVLQWACSDPDGDNLTYRVYFGIGSPPSLVGTGTAKSYNPGVLAVSQQYHWRIVARDSHGAETSGPEWTFTTRDNSPPDAPGNPFPADNGTGTTSPLLTWFGSDPDAQPLTYTLYFGDSNPPPLLAAGLAEAHYQAGPLQSGVTYYWRVVASDGTLETSGPVWHFEAVPEVVGIAGRVELWADLNASQCGLNDLTPGPINVYVFAVPGNGGGITGIQFSAPKPACFTGVYVGDELAPGMLKLGNSQAGVSIALGGCFVSPVLAMTIQYSGLGTSQNCCPYPVLPDPSLGNVLTVDCNYLEAAGEGAGLTVNEQLYCKCGPLVPVLISRFDARPGDGGVVLSWELGGDETAERYTVMRRTGDETFQVPIAAGAVIGDRGSYLDDTVEPATTYRYELVVRTHDGSEYRSLSQTVTTVTSTLVLGQNHPNPFNPVTAIPYTLPNGSDAVRVRLLILDVSGRLVRTLVNEDQTGGAREAVWEGKDDRGNPVSSGVYFYVLDVANKRLTRKLVMLK